MRLLFFLAGVAVAYFGYSIYQRPPLTFAEQNAGMSYPNPVIFFALGGALLLATFYPRGMALVTVVIAGFAAVGSLWLIAAVSLGLAILFFVVSSAGTDYFCALCGQFLGSGSARESACPRCGSNRYTTRTTD